MRYDHEQMSSQDADFHPSIAGEDVAGHDDIRVRPASDANQTQDTDVGAVVALAQTLVVPLPPRSALLRALSLGPRLLPCMRALSLYVVADGTRESLSLAGDVERHHDGAEVAAHDVWQSRKTLGYGDELDRYALDEHIARGVGKVTALPLISPELGPVGVLVAEEWDQSHAREAHPLLDVLAHCLAALLERHLRDEAAARGAVALGALGGLVALSCGGEAGQTDIAQTSAAILAAAADALRALAQPLACLALLPMPDGALRDVGATTAGAPVQLDAVRGTELLAALHGQVALTVSAGHESGIWDNLATVRNQALERTGRTPLRMTLLPVWVEDVAEGVVVMAHAQVGLDEQHWMPEAVAITIAAGAGIRALRLMDAVAQEGRERDEFISMAAHELRSPLTSTKGYAQLLVRQARKAELPDSMRQSVQAIEEQTQRMSEMVGELLDASRIRRGGVELLLATTDLVPLVQRVIEKRQLHYPRHTVTLHIEASTLVGNWDAQRVEQIARDLLDNAARYSPDGGEITIVLASAADMAQMRVRDEGVGIGPEDEGRIFDYLYRAPSAEERNLSGLGLGLFICRYLAERMGGQLMLHETSTGEPHGSEFRLLLPLGK